MKDAYQQLSKKYTDEEIAESFVFSIDLTKEEQQALQKEAYALRMKQRTAMSSEEEMYAALMQLKYQMISYIEQEYNAESSFSICLERYINIIRKTKNELAQDIGTSVSKLGKLLSGEKEPDRGFLFRLESHSNGLVPALLWWKLAMKKQEHEIERDEKERKEAYAKVKNSICIPII